jgi:hypothetical protein
MRWEAWSYVQANRKDPFLRHKEGRQKQDSEREKAAQDLHNQYLNKL